MKVKLVRQPNNDACSAFYVGGSSDPLYLRDDRIDMMKLAMSEDVCLGEAPGAVSAFERQYEIKFNVACAIVQAYDDWRKSNLDEARKRICDVITSLDKLDRRAMCESIKDLWMFIE